MASIKLKGDTSGELVIEAPAVAGTNTLTLPAATGTLLTTDGDGSALTGISSYADSDALSLLNASGSAPVYAARAWVNFNGTGTVAIRASGNVSSITDNGTGDYTVNFATALPDANYSAVASSQVSTTATNTVQMFSAVSGASHAQQAPTTSNFRLTQWYASAPQDTAYVLVSVFR
jgi:hypothetical protein